MGLMRLLIPVFYLLSCNVSAESDPDARSIVQAAIDNWRGISSYGEMSMIIHRPAWQRSMSMKSWTKGDDHSLVRITQPKKDSGSGTLMIENQMWSYSPKINRVIKIPSSMMAQSWMGSDFSNKDISRADDIIKLYKHKLVNSSQSDGHTLYTIEAIPHEDAPVVWGKELLVIRDDNVLMSHQFFDQDGILIKSMESFEIKMMSGRPVASRQRMSKADRADEWTEVQVIKIQFDLDLSKQVFTLANLRNPRN